MDSRVRYVHPVKVDTDSSVTTSFSTSVNTFKEWHYTGFTPDNNRP